MINTTIGKYKIIRSIGEGGMATVFEAEHALLGTKVAIKVLNPILSDNPQIRERFINEAKLMASLDHPNITKVIDFDDQPHQLSIVMEFLNGEDLNQKIKRRGPLNEKEIMELFSQALSAFQYAHEKGIVHRDIKPSNIFILPDGRIKILDFGIAKLFGLGNDMTQTDTQIGTPMYMSPEQVKTDKSIDYRSDIYSLGVTMFFACTGRAPYDDVTDSKYDIFNKIVQEPMPLDLVSHRFKTTIKKACEKNRAYRYQSCMEWFNELNNAINIDKLAPKIDQSNFETKGVIESNKHQQAPKNKILYTIIVFCLVVISILLYQSINKEQKDITNIDAKDSTSLNQTADNNNGKEPSNSGKAEKESKPTTDEISDKDNSSELNENIEEYRNIMIAYYYDLTNDNYEALSSYYADVLTGYMDSKPVSKYDLIESHKQYHDKFPYHTYRLADISPYKTENNTVSYFVKMNVSVSKNFNNVQNPKLLNDIYTFDENKKIVNVKIIK